MNDVTHTNPYEAPQPSEAADSRTKVADPAPASGKRWYAPAFLFLGCIIYFASLPVPLWMAGEPFFGWVPVTTSMFRYGWLGLGLMAMLAWMCWTCVEVAKRRLHPLVLLLLIPAGLASLTYFTGLQKYVWDRTEWARLQERLDSGSGVSRAYEL